VDHNLSGKSMASILNVTAAVDRTFEENNNSKRDNDISILSVRCLTPEQQKFIYKKLEKPAQKATTPSNTKLWKDLEEACQKQLELKNLQNYKEKEVTQNREKQFTSQISTLHGPAAGLHAGKVLDNASTKQVKIVQENKQISQNHETIFRSHISVLPDTVHSKVNTQDC
jgi:hypothetical protein